jgi:hypothetical protein
VAGFAIEDLERVMYERRALWRMHTIRRTLFVVSARDVPLFEAAATRDIAARERARLIGWLTEIPAAQGWLDDLSAQVMTVLGPRELTTRELGTLIPDLGRLVTIGSGKWATPVGLASRLLYLMAMDGEITRARPVGTWRSSQYRWVSAAQWSGEELPRMGVDEARAELARRYLDTHGPATLTDLRWWTGWTLGHTRAALEQVETLEVELDSGETGLVLAADGPTDLPSSKSVAFLPSLDSTIMGWKERHWYLGDHGPQLFDTAGNAGPTVWSDGSVIGGWSQLPDGEVVYELLEDVTRPVARAVRDEAGELQRWLGGIVATPRFPSPLGRRLASAV